jgi:hypothetical protein
MTCSKLLLWGTIAIGYGCRLSPTTKLDRPSSGEVRGVVLDSSSGSAIRGAQVWAVGQPIGATTDNLGQFRFRHYYGSQFTLLTRICGRENAATTSVNFSRPLPGPVIIRIRRPNTNCAPLVRPPWDVGPQDTTIFEGYVHNSWEGDSFVTCGGKLFSPHWAPGLTAHLWGGRRPEEGERVYVRLQARYDDDPSTRDLVGGPPLYVWRLLDVQSHGPASCTDH